MAVYQEAFSLRTNGKRTQEITEEVASIVRKSGISNGTATVFCRHTSSSLVLMENADPTARSDLHRFMEDLVPESYPHFEHTYEGPDDMPSHIRMVLTRSAEVIPFSNGRLLLGTWQGIFHWEHRSHPHSRSIHVTVMGE